MRNTYTPYTLSILDKWYNDNANWPYPSQSTFETLSHNTSK